MFVNGTVINGTKIETPKSFETACTIATQVLAIVASNQFGGQTISLAHLAPYVDASRQKIAKELREELDGLDYTEERFNEILERRVRLAIKSGVQTMQYQILTLNTTNGQAPFVSLCMYLGEAEDERTKADLALVIEEVLKQRIKGIQNPKGDWVSPTFPKLLYITDEENMPDDAPYRYLTDLAAQCTDASMVPDYISEKKQLELKYPDNKILTIKERRDQWGDERIWGKNPFKTLTDEECNVLTEYVNVKRTNRKANPRGEAKRIIDENGLKNKDLIPRAYPVMGAARGDETVSIKVLGEVFENIPISEAFSIVKIATRWDMHSNVWNATSPAEGAVGVYKITHIPTHQYYVGSSKNIKRRFREHQYNIRHKGCLGEYYFVNDYDLDNFTFDVLEECGADDLYEVESRYINPADSLCINHKDPRNNGNFTTENRLIALQGKPYSDVENKTYTWFRKINSHDSFIMSNGEWEPIRAIIHNDATSPLVMYEVRYQAEDGNDKTLHITEDHPLRTQRGRVIASELLVGDEVIDCTTKQHYRIVSVTPTDEKCDTYDFEVDNDIFDMSGIISHNCRSMLTPDYVHYKYYGRFNQGVVTINLPDVALSSKKDMSKFWKIFDERLELCHRALQVRINHLKGTPSDVAPILWQYGALARLEKGETIDRLLYGGYSTISLGYAGLWECVLYMTGKKLIEPEGHDFGVEVMQKMNDYTMRWRAEEDIHYSLYGTPKRKLGGVIEILRKINFAKRAEPI